MILSIVIPVYNVEKYVERCLRSCVEQDISSSEYEIIVVNDGSSDRSLELVNDFANGCANIKVMSQDNAGQSAARNAGIDVSSGDYYLFLDSDDWIAPNCLGKLTAKLRDEAPDILAFCEADDIDGRLRVRRTFPFSSPTSGKDFLGLGVSYCSKVTPFVWRAEFLRRNGLRLCQGIYHEDVEFSPRAFYLADKVSYLNEAIMFITANPGSTTRSYNPKRSFDLVNGVCPSLSKFAAGVSSDCRRQFDTVISVCLNNAFAYAVTLPKSVQVEFNEAVAGRQDLFVHLAGSGKPKYRLEEKLFRIFPKHTVQVYKAMQLFNR